MRLLYTLIILSYFCAHVQAKEPVLEIVSEHWPPYIVQGTDVNDEVSGIVTNKIRAIFDSSPIQYQINVYPWARSYYLAKNKPNVLIYSIYKTSERTPNFIWFCPIHAKTPVNIYKLKKNKTDISSLSSISSAVVGVLRNDNSHDYMLNSGFIEGQNLTVSSSEENNIQKLLRGRIDAIIQSKDALIYRIQHTNFTIDDFVVGFQLHQDTNTEHCMALSKNSDPTVINAVKRAFKLWLTRRE
ncbi:substrate-binding periplasmic protein [Cognaticolwellia mytili]|uniref:substrate-binding periplasmic protein n=1 Tax=Cognaticolwellia mytili TaxID=1888913 RepID=UPI000A17126B|nr:ABC transporter substrate-binding protein [Cognaticolwellia mytili]